MIIDIRAEKLNNSKATVVRVYKEVDDKVKPGDLLFELEANKTNISIESEAEGEIKRILVEEGQTVNSRDLLAQIKGTLLQNEPSKKDGNFDYFAGIMKPKKQELQSDIAIIGGGPGGYVAAIQAAKMGAKVVLIEKESLGGTCLNRGCIPTKALVSSAKVYKNLKEASNFGCCAENVSADIKKIIDRKNHTVSLLVDGIKYILDKHNVKVINGFGKIKDKRTVFVKEGLKEITIKTKNIIIATGSKTVTLPIPGADLENVLDSDEILQIQELPKKLVIVGGGVIGMEFAFIFSSFGVEVTVIEFLDNVLSSCDDDIIDEITEIAADQGIKIFTGSKVEEIIQGEGGEHIVKFSKANSNKYISADKVLMAVGRKPFFGGLELDSLGIKLEDRDNGIEVNKKMQTNIPNIYAIGDVTNKILLAHVASHQGIIAVKNIMGKSTIVDYNIVPSAIFTDPEIAMVGVSEKIAKEQGIDINVGKFPFGANGKALIMGENRGFVKIIEDKTTGKIIGGAIIGPQATDLIAELALAIKNSLSSKQIVDTIHAHPTTAEAVFEAALDLNGGALHFI